jgi:CHAD domain-containing protein
MPSIRANRSFSRAARDRRAQLAAGTLAVAGAAAVAGKVAADRVGADEGGGPSRAYRLKAKEGAAEGVRRIALGRAEKALNRLAGTDEEEFAVAIHGARKDLKKLRATLRLIRADLGGELFRAENQRYRDAARLLSKSRDAEVKLETLAALQSRFGEDLPGDASERWEDALERERDEMASSAAGQTPTRIGQAMEMIEEGRDRILGWSPANDSWRLVGPGLAGSYRQGRRAMKRTQAKPSAGNVHEWRKRAKDLWYQLRIVQGAWPELLGETAEQAHELTDLLGDHHDLAVLEEDLASRREVGKRKAFKALIEERQRELVACALKIGWRLYAEKPKAFSRRLERYWLAWRET